MQTIVSMDDLRQAASTAEQTTDELWKVLESHAQDIHRLARDDAPRSDRDAAIEKLTMKACSGLLICRAGGNLAKLIEQSRQRRDD